MTFCETPCSFVLKLMVVMTPFASTVSVVVSSGSVRVQQCSPRGRRRAYRSLPLHPPNFVCFRAQGQSSRAAVASEPLTPVRPFSNSKRRRTSRDSLFHSHKIDALFLPLLRRFSARFLREIAVCLIVARIVQFLAILYFPPLDRGRAGNSDEMRCVEPKRGPNEGRNFDDAGNCVVIFFAPTTRARGGNRREQREDCTCHARGEHVERNQLLRDGTASPTERRPQAERADDRLQSNWPSRDSNGAPTPEIAGGNRRAWSPVPLPPSDRAAPPTDSLHPHHHPRHASSRAARSFSQKHRLRL